MIRFQPIPTAPVPPPRCETSLVERMADDMREMAFAGQNVNAETLGYRGWTALLIKRLGPQAAAIARRKSTRQIVSA
jgi:hypothetical protein